MKSTKLGRIENYDKVLPVLEIYRCVQSEGSRAGYPTICVRTTGCTHRCWFNEGGWCDSFYTSIEPEKGKYCFNDIVKMYEDNPHIKEMMLTGGSPSMHGDLVNELTHFAKENGIFITMETEGSHYLETDYPINLLSISPKFSNSIPKLGIKMPTSDKVVGEKFIKQHNKFRLHYDNIAKSIMYHSDYHIKPVLDKDLSIVNELEFFIVELSKKLAFYSTSVEFSDEEMFELEGDFKDKIESKVWCMPVGDDIPALLESYGPVMDFVRDRGFKFTGRPHIIGFGTRREV